MPSEGATCHLHLFLPPSHAVHVSGLRMWGERNELLWQPPAWTGKPRVTHQLSLAPGESAGWDLSGPELCPLGAGWCKSREASPCTLSAHPTHSLGLQRRAETSLLEAWTSQRLSGLWVTVLDRVFQGLLDQGWGGGCGLLKPVHGLFQAPARAQAVSLLVALWGSKTPLRSPGHRALEATLPDGASVRSSMPNYSRWGQNKGRLILPQGWRHYPRVCCFNLHFFETTHFLSPAFLPWNFWTMFSSHFSLEVMAFLFLLKFFVFSGYQLFIINTANIAPSLCLPVMFTVLFGLSFRSQSTIFCCI